MARKVYWKGLLLTLQATSRYIERWNTQLEESLTSDQFDCVSSLLNAIIDCINLLPRNTPEN